MSGTGRNVGSDPDMVQFDAPANPGSSGGPLLDSNGRVVAVCTEGAVTKQNMNHGVLGANARDVVKRFVP